MKYFILAVLLAFSGSITVIAFDWKAKYEFLLDEWIDQEKKILRLENENKRLKTLLYDGAIPMPEVNEDPFAEPEEIPL